MELLSRALVVWLVCVLVLASPAGAELLINEVLGDPNQDWDGDGSINLRGDEWIEVRNNGGSSEDLSNYYLRDDYGADVHMQLSGVLEPQEVAVFYGSDAVAWQQQQGLTGIGFSINNSGEAIELLHQVDDPAGPQLVMIHRVIIPDHCVEDDRSLGWDLLTETWNLFDGLNPYNGAQEPQGTDCIPTPGQINDCVPNVPISRTTWDHLKSQYR